jgi:hypothetical protein
MNSSKTSIALNSVAAVCVLWALVLHGRFFFSAGALWRDEANSVVQAGSSSWKALWGSLRYDSFPALYPALLRPIVPDNLPSGERSLRVFGVAIGVATGFSVLAAGKVLRSGLPVVAFALLAIDPIFISEGDSVRPYGIGLLCLMWSFCAYGRLLRHYSTVWLIVASAASVLTVQASYTGAMFVAILSLTSAGLAFRRSGSRMLWKMLLPGLLAAASLLPYAETLRQVPPWASILHYQTDWGEYVQGYVRTHSIASLLAWLLVALFGAGSFTRLVWPRRSTPGSPDILLAFGSLVGAGAIAAQIVFVQIVGVPPFPRYFLPGLLLAAFALDLWLGELKPSVRGVVALTVMLLTALPAWTWLRLRHSNADRVGEILANNAGPSDLVIISPWFLHPSFQIYYRGRSPWVTVPDLPQQPLTRYDLVRDAMTDPEREERLNHRMQQSLAGGGTLWLVSQGYPDRLTERLLLKPPVLSAQVGGEDYQRFRSYWERAIIQRLYDCCTPAEWPLPPSGPVWEEERLTLTRWSPNAMHREKK